MKPLPVSSSSSSSRVPAKARHAATPPPLHVKSSASSGSGSTLLTPAMAKLGKVPAPPGGLKWTKRAIRVPFRYSLKT